MTTSDAPDDPRAALLARRAALLDSAPDEADTAASVELDQARVGRLSRMDALQGQALATAAKQRREVELARIDSALRRLDPGDYGVCVRCEEEIAAARLRADPAAPLCIACARAAEQR